MALSSWRSPRCKYLVSSVIVLYLLLTIYSAYVLLSRNSISKDRGLLKDAIHEDNRSTEGNSNIHLSYYTSKSNLERMKGIRKPVVEIWGKAAIGEQSQPKGKPDNFKRHSLLLPQCINIDQWQWFKFENSEGICAGLYLWEHIFGGSLQTHQNRLTRSGNLSFRGIEFRFRTGPGVVQGYVPTDVKHLVLVLNGRDQDKVLFARQWLDYVRELPLVREVAVLLLGNEKCENDWLLPYMVFRGGKVRVVLLVYDSPLVDNHYFHQWPLGVATYRNFPRIVPGQVRAEVPRKHLCNFIGTVYPSSSRETLVHVLNSTHLSSECVVHRRTSWQPGETEESLQDYVATLLDSDLTLSPVGINAECYRIYEALATGSIPVVEDVVTDGTCVPQTSLRLLKAHKAPLLYVTDWQKQLPRILEQHERLPLEEMIARRQNVLNWYRNFTKSLREQFVEIIKAHLFGT